MNYQRIKKYWEKEESKVHRGNENDLRKFAENIVEILELNYNQRILDVGCGEGSVDFYLKQKVKKLSGFDFSSNKLAKAIKKNPECHYWNQSFLNDYKDKNFDVVFSFSVMQYCHPLHQFEFLDKSIMAVTSNGLVAHLDIPDYSKIFQYYITGQEGIRKKIIGCLKYIIYKIYPFLILYRDGSYWSNLKKLKRHLEANGFHVDLKDSECYYRSHLVISRIKKSYSP